MKKKLMFLVAIIACALCFLCGCDYKEKVKAKDFVPDSNRFVLLETQALSAYDHLYVLCDRETRVIYLLTHLHGGGLTVMVDENGKPLLYEGEL